MVDIDPEVYRFNIELRSKLLDRVTEFFTRERRANGAMSKNNEQLTYWCTFNFDSIGAVDRNFIPESFRGLDTTLSHMFGATNSIDIISVRLKYLNHHIASIYGRGVIKNIQQSFIDEFVSRKEQEWTEGLNWYEFRKRLAAKRDLKELYARYDSLFRKHDCLWTLPFFNLVFENKERG